MNLFALKKLIRENLNSFINEIDYEGIDIPEKTPDDDGTPASSRQTWALFSITKKDFRKANLTAKQASELITKLNSEKGYVRPQITGNNTAPLKAAINGDSGKIKLPSLKQYYLEQLPRLVRVLQNQMGIESTIGDDPMTVLPGQGKSYAFFGGGLGFAWLKYDKRSKIAKKVDEEANKIKPEIDKLVINAAFSKIAQQAYQDKGWPLQAMTFQNEAYKRGYLQIAVDYLNALGIENVYVDSRLD